MAAPANVLTSTCSCGNVEIEAAGASILSAACHCDDCQSGARRIEALPNAGPVLDPHGGSPYILFRKDRVTYTKGATLLKSYKLKEKSPTNRVVATCCNSAMLLNFDDSKHWVSMYRSRFKDTLPPLQIRVCTKFANGDLPGDVPSYATYPANFIGKLIAARLAMLFGRQTRS